MPEGEPRSQGLANVNHQDRNRTAIADETHNHGGVQNGLQLGALQNVDQKSCEERARPQGNDPQIEEDPEAEGETIVHVGLVQTVVKAQTSGVNPNSQHNGPRREPEQESRKRGALLASGDPPAVGNSG